MNGFEPERFEKQKRMLIVSLSISLLIQVIIIISYVFKEKQMALAFPMVLGVLISVFSLVNLMTLGK